VITAQFTGVQAMRAAGATDMPLRLSDVATQVIKDIDAATKAPQYDGIDLSGLRATAVAYQTSAKAFDARLLAAERSGDAGALDALERKAMVARDVFWMPDGLSYNKYWHTIDRYVAPFPELNYAAYETTGRDADVKTAIDRLTAAMQKAIAAIG
jgi:FAD/FMN-containing dehydrogenase